MKTLKEAHVFRYHETIALHCTAAGTVYLEPGTARRIASALLQCADAVDDILEYPSIDISEATQ